MLARGLNFLNRNYWQINTSCHTISYKQITGGKNHEKLLIFLSLIATTQAQLSIGLGINTTHITAYDEKSYDYDFYENNKLITLEYEKDNHIVGVVSFDNSFGNPTVGIYGGKIYDKNSKGFYSAIRIGLLKGYNSVDFLPSKSNPTELVYGFRNPAVFYEDYSLLAEVGIGYQLNKKVSLETNLIANAVVSSIKYSF